MVILILLVGYIVCYSVFFVVPTFLLDSHMKFPGYIPAMDPVGFDLNNILRLCKMWWVEGTSPYADSTLYHPPLAVILFLPLIFCSYKAAYCIVSILTLFCFILSVAVFPLLIARGKHTINSLTVFFVLTGLTSYGLLFELERGQWNVIAMTCGTGAYYFFLHGKRCVAYLLLSLAITLKVYPLIYIVLLLDSNATWKKTVFRIACVGALNVALLFVLGWNTCADFLGVLSHRVEWPSVWVGNHSIRAFSIWIWKDGPQSLVLGTVVIMATITLAAIVILITRARTSRNSFVWRALVSVSTIAACLIPSASHDYKLSLVPFAVGLFFQSFLACDRAIITVVQWSCVCIISGMYGLLLSSYVYKPVWMAQNTIPLFTILIAMTYLSIGISNEVKLSLEHVHRNGQRNKPSFTKE